MASHVGLEQIAKNLGHHDTALVIQFRRSAKINEEKKQYQHQRKREFCDREELTSLTEKLCDSQFKIVGSLQKCD